MSIENAEHFHQEKQFPPIIKRVAEIHELNLTDEEINNMGLIATTCGIADDIVDQCKDPELRKKIAANAFGYLRGTEVELIDTGNAIQPAYAESMNYLKEYVSTLTPERKDLLLLWLGIWNRLSDSRRKEEDLDESLRQRKADLGFTSVIYLTALSEENRNNPNYRQFVKDVKRMVRVAGMLDDASDLPRDNKDGVVAIKPSIANRLRILKEGVEMGAPMAGHLLEPTLVVESVKIMIREFRRRGEQNYDQYNIERLGSS